MKTVLFGIRGMHCASCAIRNEQSIKQLPGITEVVVNFNTQTAQVTYQERKVNLDRIYEAVKKAGYAPVLEINFEQQYLYEQKQLQQDKEKVGLAVLFSVPVLLFSMLPLSFPYAFLGINITQWISLLLSSLVILVLGWEFHKSMWHQGRFGLANMDTLISFGTLMAWSASLWAFVHQQPTYFETGSFIITFVLLGNYIERKSRGKASSALLSLVSLQTKEVHALIKGKVQNIALENVKKGLSLEIRPGEKIPVDGLVIKGETTVDESMLTGESMPVSKEKGSGVFAATINQQGVVVIKVQKMADQTVFARIVRHMISAQTSKAPIQTLVDSFSSLFVYAVIGIALITISLWYVYTLDVNASVTYAVAVLVIACPCALGLATPTALLVGTGIGAKQGILIKNTESLERAKHIDVVVFDKTGTLTLGKPQLIALESCDFHVQKKELLHVAASLSQSSTHPLSVVVMSEAKQQRIPLRELDQFENVPGYGVTGVLEGKRYFLGNEKFMKKMGISLQYCQQVIDALQRQARTLSFLANDTKIIGVFSFSDTIRKEAPKAIKKLQEAGIEVHMLTGDTSQVSAAVAHVLGIDTYTADLLPDEKREYVQKLQKQGKKVAFVGDGINDSVALVQADLGMAMGQGTDVAVEAGHIVLVKQDLRQVALALQLSTLTFRVIQQNLFWAVIYNCLAIPVAAFGLLNPVVASAAMAASSIAVVLNSLRIRLTGL